MKNNAWDQFTEIIMASMNLAVSRLYHERFPEQPHGSDEIEYAEENLFQLCDKLVTPEEPNLDSDSPEGERVMATLERVDGPWPYVFPVDPPLKPEEDLRMSDDEVMDLVHGKDGFPPIHVEREDPFTAELNRVKGFPEVWTPEHLKQIEFTDQPEWEKDPFASKDERPCVLDDPHPPHGRITGKHCPGVSEEPEHGDDSFGGEVR
jgi:hypothetical protein